MFADKVFIDAGSSQRPGSNSPRNAQGSSAPATIAVASWTRLRARRVTARAPKEGPSRSASIRS